MEGQWTSGRIPPAHRAHTADHSRRRMTTTPTIANTIPSHASIAVLSVGTTVGALAAATPSSSSAVVSALPGVGSVVALLVVPSTLVLPTFAALAVSTTTRLLPAG